MLERECAATAASVGEMLTQSPLQQAHPLSDESVDLFVSHLTLALTSMVQLTKRSILAEVQRGRRAIAVPLSASAPDSMLSLAAEYAGIEAITTRLAWASGRIPKLFSGYVTVREGEQLRVLFPALQLALEALQQALAGAKPTPQGSFVTASTRDGCHRVMLQKSYPAYSLYEAETRVTPHATWLSVERIGNDQLVALLAQAYHKEHWFVQQNDLIWYPQ